MTDSERLEGSTSHQLISLSDENIAVAEAVGINPAIHENDFTFHSVDRRRAADGGRERAVKEYFNLGRYSAELTKTMITDVRKVYEAVGWDWAPRRVLDFASGYGCTARHLRHVFPDSLCATCDIHIDAVNFNKDILGMESYISSPVPEQLKVPPQDVIFAHSFFSHMPESTWARWLKALANALAPRGVLIFTTNGYVLDEYGIPGLEVKANGFGFIPQSEQHDLDGEEYGGSISHSRWVLPVLASMPELRLSKFHEGFWWGSEDTYVCVKEPERLVLNVSSDLPKFGTSISFGKRGQSEEAVGPGWSYQETAYRWMIGEVSEIALPIPANSSAADFILMLRVTPYTANGQIDGQRCTVMCGTKTVAETKLSMSSWIGFRISADASASEKLTIVFVHPDAASPKDFGISPDSRELAIAVHEAVVMPVTEADESMGWRGRTGQFVSSNWRAQALGPDWKKIASKFQSMGRDCEFGLVQRLCEAEPLGLFRFGNVQSHTLIQCLRSEFSELADEDKFKILTFPAHWDYVGKYENLDLFYHTFVSLDQKVDVDTFRRKELARMNMLARLFREDLDDGEKIFVLLRREAPLDEFEVWPVISLMRRYNPKAALLWITVAGPNEGHLVGQCEMVGNNLIKGYVDRFGTPRSLWNTLSLECWKDVLVSALQALGRPIPTLAQDRPPEQERLGTS